MRVALPLNLKVLRLDSDLFELNKHLNEEWLVVNLCKLCTYQNRRVALSRRHKMSFCFGYGMDRFILI